MNLLQSLSNKFGDREGPAEKLESCQNCVMCFHDLLIIARWETAREFHTERIKKSIPARRRSCWRDETGAGTLVIIQVAEVSQSPMCFTADKAKVIREGVLL